MYIKLLNINDMNEECNTTYILNVNTEGVIDISKGPFIAVLFDENKTPIANYEFGNRVLNSISSLSYKAVSCRIKWYDGEKKILPTSIYE